MLYLIIFIIILILAIYEIYNEIKLEKSFNIIYIIITIMAVFRYGVGTDYFSYMYLYNNTLKINKTNFFKDSVHVEKGYNLLQSLFKTFDLNFYTFISVIALISMLCFYFYIKNRSKYYMVSLLIFYSMYYFTYINSAIRQGLTLALFVFVLLPLIEKRKYITYILLTFIFSYIHTSILIALIIPLISFFNIDKKKFNIAIIFSIVISNINLGFILKPFNKLYNSYQMYFSNDISILAILSRLIIFCLIIYIYTLVSDKGLDNDKKIFNYYLAGLIIYILFYKSPLIASRLNVYFKCLEIILIPNLIGKLNLKKINKNVIIAIIILLMTTMYYKEIYAALDQGNYFNKNILKYKYVTVFNKDDIFNYRPK